MLSIRNVTKIYRSKAGNEVRALNNVSIDFPETGMVFILGKSGSGKSTLLNVIGGLDGCDSGEFIIKGKSSKNFAGSDFDAYRNTFIGFIFQEYNILDDFTVGQNIGLALELQGKKATSEKINEILAKVEMLDYAKRKPNELSGGQKQRIAIARALVKDPEIIMADEPTGALDSNTGKQIFDTLKELSKTKLVLVVSHDRDFAERYGDRIIEMMDGNVASDVTKHHVESKSMSKGIIQMSDSLLRIEKGYQLTQEDLRVINEYLASHQTDIIVSGDKRLNESVRTAAGISEDNKSSVFKETVAENDVKLKSYDGAKTKFIRSSLPVKNAVKMGSSSLNHKKFRLVMTIFLSLIAFTLFGLAHTMGSYDKITATTNSIKDSNVQNASFSLGLKYEAYSGSEFLHSGFESAAMNTNDISMLNKKLGIDFVPVFNGSMRVEKTIQFTGNLLSDEYIQQGTAFSGMLHGFASMTEQRKNQLGFNLTGSLPASDDEIVISELIYRQFKANGYTNGNTSISADKLTMDIGNTENSIIGKTIKLNVGRRTFSYKIVGVLDTGFDYQRYEKYVPDTSKDNGISAPQDGNLLLDSVMLTELANTLQFGFHCLGYVTDNAITAMSEFMEIYYYESSYLGEHMQLNVSLVDKNKPSGGDGIGDIIIGGGISIGGGVVIGGLEFNGYSFSRVGNDTLIPRLGEINWIDGIARTKLAENEMLVNTEVLNMLMRSTETDIYDKYVTELTALINTYGGAGEKEINLETLEELAAYKYLGEAINDSKIKDRAIELYRNFHWDPSFTPSDDELIDFIRNNYFYWNTQEIEGLKSHYEVVGKTIAKLLTSIFGIEEERYQNIPSQRLYDLVRNTFYLGSKGDKDGEGEFTLIINSYRIRDLLNELYAYNIIFESGSQIHKDRAFFDNCITQYSGADWDEYINEWSEEQRLETAANAYRNYLNQEYNKDSSYGDISYEDISAEVSKILEKLSGKSITDYLDSLVLTTQEYTENAIEKRYPDYKIVGFFESTEKASNLIVSNTFYDVYTRLREENEYYHMVYTPHDDGIYSFAIAPMPTDTDSIRRLVEFNYTDENGVAFHLQNQVMNSLEFFNEFIEVGAKIFIYVGLGFALFAALMMMNFISTSISYKRREIGILRAVGARSSDVFKIFFSEALIIALINYVLSIVGTVTTVIIINGLVRKEGLNITLLNFGIAQIVLMLLISVAVALIASFLPVWNIARRKPVDAIKNT